MSDPICTHLTLDGLREIIQRAGYRIEAATDPVLNVTYLRSATNGLAFDVRPGNRVSGDDQAFLDVAFVAVLQVQGEFPLSLVNHWNATRRFARLQLSHPFLVLTFDISIAGGVMPNYLRAQIEIWDHLVQQLIAYLREELPKVTASRDADPAGAQLGGEAKQDHAAPSAPMTVQ